MNGRRGMIPLWMMGVLAAIALVAFVIWTRRQTSDVTGDGRTAIVFWGNVNQIGEEIYNLVHEFERQNPQYRVILSTAAARDYTSDAQRLMCAIAGEVPPDVVWFDRFAIGEWAARSALTDLRPFLESQRADDPYRINLDDYYDFTIAETSYKRPGAEGPAGVFGIPTGADVRALYINCDALRQAQLVDEHGNPKPPRTWEELRQYATKLTVYRTPGDKRSGIVRLGFAPNYGNSWLYLYSWQAGGEFMNADRTRVTMNTPPNVRALQYMSEVYDELGGYAA
jgi:multiple sugar transport system permease protein